MLIRDIGIGVKVPLELRQAKEKISILSTSLIWSSLTFKSVTYESQLSNDFSSATDGDSITISVGSSSSPPTFSTYSDSGFMRQRQRQISSYAVVCQHPRLA